MRQASSRRDVAEKDRLPYHGKTANRLSAASLLATPIAVGLLAMLLGGCSMQLSSMLPGGVSDTGPTVVRTSDPDVTGSIPLHMASTGNIPTGMSAIDWPLARAALREALSRTDDGPSVPWENPASGARGTVTPIAAAFTKDGMPCRNFIASHVKDGVETWSEGLACRTAPNVWDVMSVKPLKKS
ncbi:MAG TPA: RT0821/Lpp0805 family surface protein [Xanthobacteraceae bacterium]|nr:RT0821/Lpp0805 family surface protein [Xanthobacteraceae bacterium]